MTVGTAKILINCVHSMLHFFVPLVYWNYKLLLEPIPNPDEVFKLGLAILGVLVYWNDYRSSAFKLRLGF